MIKIPVCEPTLKENVMAYVKDCIETNWISSNGKYISKFEELFAKYVNAKHAITCSNGTTALHLAVRALNLTSGDEIIVPDFTMMATVNAILYVGAKPIFVDVERDTWNIDVNKIKEKITPRTKAIMVVHIYGHPVDMDPILEIAKKHNLFVIEDAAEAHGAEYKSKRVGCLGDIGCFSFYANKIISTGEGGMVVTNNDLLSEKIRLLKNLAFTTPRFLHSDLGYNYRMTNIQAAIGVAQMEHADEFVLARRNNAKLYNQLLKDVEGITLPVEKEWAKNVYWMYGVVVEDSFGLNMQQLREELLKRGVDTRTFFLPMHSQPIVLQYFPEFIAEKDNYPITEELSKKGLYLPSSSHLTKEQIIYIVEQIRDIKKNINKFKNEDS